MRIQAEQDALVEKRARAETVLELYNAEQPLCHEAMSG